MGVQTYLKGAGDCTRTHGFCEVKIHRAFKGKHVAYVCMGVAEGLPWYTTHKWASLRHVNGVSVYQEEEGPNGQGGAFMVSAIVRTSPQAVFKVWHPPI
jgi:hypothetical protein